MHANKTANVALVWTLLGYCKYMLPELTANAYTFMGNFGLTCMYIFKTFTLVTNGMCFQL